MKRILIVGSGIIGSLVGLGFVFPAVAELQRNAALPTAGVLFLLLGIVLVLGSIALPAFVLRRAR